MKLMAMNPANYLLGFIFLYPLSCCVAEYYFFIFGDSLYDPGNNIFITPDEHIPSYHPPYGTTFFNHSTGRFSDGRISPDFIAAYLNLPFMPPILDPEGNFTYGANFASGGGGVFDTNPKALSFRLQIEKFKELAATWTAELGADEATTRLMSAVYLISMGGNDYFPYIFDYPNATVPEQQAYVDTVVGNLTILVKEMYDVGARKFMFQNAAPIGCMPMMKQNFNLEGDACAGKPLVLAQLHNAALPKAIDELISSQSLTQFIYSIFDYYTAIGNRINDPTTYGFKVGDVACCGIGSHRGSDCGSTDKDYELCFDPNQYVFFDGGHNTDHANSQMADLMWNGTNVEPYSIKQLFDFVPVTTLSWESSGLFAN